MYNLKAEMDIDISSCLIFFAWYIFFLHIRFICDLIFIHGGAILLNIYLFLDSYFHECK